MGIYLLLLTAAMVLSACGGGSSAPPNTGGPTNSSPVANAGSDLTVKEQSFVTLNGSGSDPDPGTTLTFSWTQLSGPAVTIVNSNQVQASFTTPDVAPNLPPTMNTVNLSGKLLYQFVPPEPGCNGGLDYPSFEERRIRQATVQIFGESSSQDLVFQLTVNDGDGGTSSDTVGVTVHALLASTVSDDNGDYAALVPSQSDVSVRVRAELKKNSGPSWDVEVRDNTLNTDAALGSRPLYVLDGSVFPTGNTDVFRNLTATTGWGGASYTGVRAAAPFAVLDAIYSTMSVILTEDPLANFPALDVFWSVNNSSAQGTGTPDEDIASGEIGTSFYSGNRLFLLGKENDDTEEFDDHVVVHEWGHYFEDNFSRSDSIGGAHGLGQSLDMRLAFGEGFATAMSGIGLNDPIYCDTSGAEQSGGFRINIETGVPGVEGWYNEVSVLNLIYDLWDTDNDAIGSDNDSIGFGPIYDVMTAAQATTPAFTSIFSFATELKALMQIQDPTKVAFIDNILGDHDITAANIDIYGSNEANDGPGTPLDVLPIYTDVPIGAPFQICSNSQFDNGRDGNKLSEYRYLILDVNPASAFDITVDTVNPPSQPSAGFDCTADPNNPENHEHSDPDIGIYQNGTIVWGGFSCEPNSEVTRSPVLAGRYVLDVVEFRYLDDESPVGFPERTCFDITIAP